MVKPTQGLRPEVNSTEACVNVVVTVGKSDANLEWSEYSDAVPPL